MKNIAISEGYTGLPENKFFVHVSFGDGTKITDTSTDDSEENKTIMRSKLFSRINNYIQTYW